MNKLLYGLLITLFVVSLAPASLAAADTAQTTGAAEPVVTGPATQATSEYVNTSDAVKKSVLDNNKNGFTVNITKPNAYEPNIYVYEARPGDQITDYATIRNFNDKSYTFYIYGADKTKDKNGDDSAKLKTDQQTAFGTWVTLAVPETKLEGKTEVELKFQVTIPKDTPLGDYTGAIAVEREPESLNTESPNLKTVMRIVRFVKIKVTDDPKPVLSYAEAYRNTWIKTILYYSTLAVFAGCALYLIFHFLKRRKHKKDLTKK